MIGWYAMGAAKSVDQKFNVELNKAFEERGALYSLFYLFDGESDAFDPQVVKEGKLIKFRFEIDPLQKYCA